MPKVSINFRDINIVKCAFEFTITSDDETMQYTFIVWEAELIPLAKWEDMYNGVTGIYTLYQGNSEGYIEVTDDGFMEFVGAPSGSGGDVKGVMRIPHALVKPALMRIVDEAANLVLLK